jgi:hypothetical protein
MVLSLSCRGHISNEFDDFKMVCGADAPTDKNPVIAFRVTGTRLSDRLAVTGTFLQSESERRFESRTGCISVEPSFQGIVMARSSAGDHVGSIAIGADSNLRGLNLVSLHPNPLTSDLWDQCGDSGLLLPDGAFLFKVLKGRTVAFPSGAMTITRDGDQTSISFSERGCFVMSALDLEQGVTITTPEGAGRKFAAKTLPSLTTKGINSLVLCEKNQYWDLTQNSCQSGKPQDISEFFAKPEYQLVAKNMMTSGCLVDTREGVRNCPQPKTFNELDQNYFLLQKFSTAVLNDERMQNFPVERETLSRSVSLALREMESTDVFQQASAEEDRLTVPLVTRTGMKILSTIDLPFSLRYRGLNQLQLFVGSDQDLVLLKSLQYRSIIISDVNTYDSSGRIIFFNSNNDAVDIRRHVDFVKTRGR